MVVNCAALSVPRECEANPDKAMSVNVPHTLVKWLSSFEGKRPLLIHLSTDQGKWYSISYANIFKCEGPHFFLKISFVRFIFIVLSL